MLGGYRQAQGGGHPLSSEETNPSGLCGVRSSWRGETSSVSTL